VEVISMMMADTMESYAVSEICVRMQTPKARMKL
jgi:hypothetical protein